MNCKKGGKLVSAHFRHPVVKMAKATETPTDAQSKSFIVISYFQKLELFMWTSTTELEQTLFTTIALVGMKAHR